ncbi:hypothetical protein J2T11_004171 [Paenarthrobacter nicotinovorans]|nr:hypothetical protein [Paenarthrobacter nicotinovorans]
MHGLLFATFPAAQTRASPEMCPRSVLSAICSPHGHIATLPASSSDRPALLARIAYDISTASESASPERRVPGRRPLTPTSDSPRDFCWRKKSSTVSRETNAQTSSRLQSGDAVPSAAQLRTLPSRSNSNRRRERELPSQFACHDANRRRTKSKRRVEWRCESTPSAHLITKSKIGAMHCTTPARGFGLPHPTNSSA